MQGNLFVCSRANGNCCCGWEEKGRAPVNAKLYQAEWERHRLRPRLHLSFTGCLGVCTVGNNALLLILGRPIWLKAGPPMDFSQFENQQDDPEALRAVTDMVMDELARLVNDLRSRFPKRWAE